MTKKTSPKGPDGAKLYRPTIERRLDKTESFFKKVAKQCERRALAHNLKNPSSEDYHSATLIVALGRIAEESAGKVRQPTLI